MDEATSLHNTCMIMICLEKKKIKPRISNNQILIPLSGN